MSIVVFGELAGEHQVVQRFSAPPVLLDLRRDAFCTAAQHQISHLITVDQAAGRLTDPVVGEEFRQLRDHIGPPTAAPSTSTTTLVLRGHNPVEKKPR